MGLEFTFYFYLMIHLIIIPQIFPGAPDQWRPGGGGHLLRAAHPVPGGGRRRDDCPGKGDCLNLVMSRPNLSWQGTDFLCPKERKNLILISFPQKTSRQINIFISGPNHGLAEHYEDGRRRLHLHRGHHCGSRGSGHLQLQQQDQRHHRAQCRGGAPGLQHHWECGGHREDSSGHLQTQDNRCEIIKQYIRQHF